MVPVLGNEVVPFLRKSATDSRETRHRFGENQPQTLGKSATDFGKNLQQTLGKSAADFGKISHRLWETLPRIPGK